MRKEEFELEQLKREIPQLRKSIEITKRHYPNKAVLIEENRKTIKRIEKINKEATKINQGEIEYRLKHEINFLKGRSWLMEKLTEKYRK